MGNKTINKGGRKTEHKIKLVGLNCPHCSAKIQGDVQKLSFVKSADINLVNQTLSVVTGESVEGNLLSEVEAIVHKYEPDVSVKTIDTEKRNLEKFAPVIDKKTLLRLLVGAGVFAFGIVCAIVFSEIKYLSLMVFVLSYIILGYDVVLRALKNIFKGNVFDENFLMSISTLCAFAIGEYPEAVAVMLFYQVGEMFQQSAIKKSRKSIAQLMDINPDYAYVERDNEILKVEPSEVKIGEIVLVKPGEKIPLDGEVIDGEANLDTVALTGESVPKFVKVGQKVLSGCINLDSPLKIKAEKEYSESTASKIISLVENASSKKSKAENFITVFSRFYTPIVVVLAVLLAVVPPLVMGGDWTQWIRRGCVFLVISCPCALVISIPMTFFGGLGAASKKGVLVKGSNYLEALSNIETIAFDKTGTLTKGVFEVVAVNEENGFSKKDVLKFAASAEAFSNHPIAKSIIKAYGSNEQKLKLLKSQEKSGLGIVAELEGYKALVGNEKLMQEMGVEYIKNNASGTKVYVSVNGIYAGSIVVSDEIKSDSKNAISELKKQGVKKCVMLTGDNVLAAEAVSKRLMLDEYYAQILPQQKVETVERLLGEKSKKGKVVFVGDGINDAPVLARADVGIAMGAFGSDAAIEAADVVLMSDEPSKIIDAVKVSKATKIIAAQNIIFAVGVKVILLVLGAFGIAGMWEAVFGDVGVAVIAVLNSMRMLRK